MKKTPLYDEHVSLGAKIIHFGDWLMPVSYSSMVEEHVNVRTNAGLFDVSHMGEFFVSGPQAQEFLDYYTPNNVKKLVPGKIHYTNLLTPGGTIVDDLLIYRIEEEKFLLVVNALNIEKDFAYLKSSLKHDAVLENKSDEYAQVALQGRHAVKIIEKMTEKDLSEMKMFTFFYWHLNGSEMIISRTGYTGEDGFEIYMPAGIAVKVWNTLLDLGREYSVCPCGLGARDSLRLEAGLPLYGNDIDDTTTPIEADLSWIVKFKKGDFIAKDLLKSQSKEGTRRILTGIQVLDKAIPRQGYKIFSDEKEIGIITSGTKSPYTNKSIAMGYILPELNNLDREIQVQVRNKFADAKIVTKTFFERDY